MTDKDYLWSELVRKNPRLLDDPHFTPEGLRKFFERVYEAAWNAGYKSARDLAPRNPFADKCNPFADIFR